MEGIYLYIALIGAFILGGLLTALIISRAPRGKQMSVMVTSAKTGEKYAADHYYVARDGTPHLRI